MKKKVKSNTRLVRIDESVVQDVEIAIKPTKTPIGYYFQLAAIEKIQNDIAKQKSK